MLKLSRKALTTHFDKVVTAFTQWVDSGQLYQAQNCYTPITEIVSSVLAVGRDTRWQISSVLTCGVYGTCVVDTRIEEILLKRISVNGYLTRSLANSASGPAAGKKTRKLIGRTRGDGSISLMPKRKK